jgi:hypothetical protein
MVVKLVDLNGLSQRYKAKREKERPKQPMELIFVLCRSIAGRVSPRDANSPAVFGLWSVRASGLVKVNQKNRTAKRKNATNSPDNLQHSRKVSPSIGGSRIHTKVDHLLAV